MDRELRVFKDEMLLIELIFNYRTKTTGRVKITVNRIYDLGEDMKSSYPIFQFDDYVHHPAPLTTLDEVKAFDLAFIKRLPTEEAKLEGNIRFSYDPVQYRYIVGDNTLVGIADVTADFLGNTKEMRFLSVRRLREDGQASSHSFETNMEMLKTFCEEYLNHYQVDFKLVGWHL